MPDSPQHPLQATSQVLNDRLAALSGEVTQQVWTGVPSYSAVLLSRAELETQVDSSLRLVCSALTQASDLDPDELIGSRRLGRSRALQGVPIESLMRSYRTGERATIEVYTRTFRRFSDDLSVHRQGVKRIQNAFDQMEEATLDAYRATQLELALPQERTSADFVARLAADEHFATAELEAIAEGFGMHPNHPHVGIAASAGTPEAVDALGPIRHHLSSRLLEIVHRPILTGEIGGVLLFLVPASDPDTAAIAAAFTRALTPQQCRHEVVAAIGSVQPDLRSVTSSINQAMQSIDVASKAGYRREVVAYHDVLVEVLLASNRAVAEHLVGTVLGPLHDQEHLLQTLAVYLDSRQSTAATARALVVHNNTVTYRLRRVMQLTGRDLQSTDDLLFLHLAMRAQRLLGGHTHLRPLSESSNKPAN